MRSGISEVPIRWLRMREVEGGVGRIVLDDMRLQRLRVARGEEVERAGDGGLSALAADVHRHRAMGDARDTGLVETGQQETGIAVAEPGLGSGGGRELLQHALGDAVGAIAAARPPDRIECGIIGEFENGGGAGVIGPGEMAVIEKALRMDGEFDLRDIRGGELR